MLSTRLLACTIPACLVFGSAFLGAQEKNEEEKPIQALFVTGGSTHAYKAQQSILAAGIRARVGRKIEWMVRHQGQGRSDEKIPLFESEAWAEGYDIVVHNYCFPRVYDEDYVGRILKPHREKGIPAVLIHATMRSFPLPDDRWFEFCGVTSRKHGAHHPLTVEWLKPEDPILKGLQPWKTTKGELYFLETLKPGAVSLAEAFSEQADEKHPVVWTHRYGPEQARVFGTTIGNDVETVANPTYLDVLARGFLWALDDLSEETFQKVAPDDSLPGLSLPELVSNLPQAGHSLASEGTASALSSRVIEGFLPGFAIDGAVQTYWEAESPGPAVWQVVLDEAATISAFAIDWKGPIPDIWQVEGSPDGESWQLLEEKFGRAPQRESGTMGLFDSISVKYLRVTVPTSSPGERIGIREFAAYESEDDVPSGFLIDFQPDSVLRTLGDRGIEGEIRLAPGWSLDSWRSLPAGVRPRQMLETALGSVFVIGEGQASDTIYSLWPRENGETATTVFLDNRAPGCTAVWDGEWVSLLEGVQWNAYRDTNGDRKADERLNRGAILKVERGSPEDIQISDLRLTLDGWCYGNMETSGEVTATDRMNRLHKLPKFSLVRFRLDGSRFEIVLSSSSAISGFAIDSGFHRYLQTIDEKKGTETRRVLPIPGASWSGSDPIVSSPSVEKGVASWKSEFVLVEDERFSLLQTWKQQDGDNAVRAEIIASLPISNLVTANSLQPWVALPESANSWVISRLRQEGTNEEPVVWDDVSNRELWPLLEADSPVIQKEAVFEVLRRKSNFQKRAAALLQKEESPGYVGALAILAQSKDEDSFEKLGLAAQKRPNPIAFRFLGDHRNAKTAPAFGEIAKANSPALSAAILAAIQHSETQITGLNELVLQFVASDNSLLATTAKHFLQEEAASAVCFAILDDPAESELHDAAFRVLSGIHFASVAEGIALRLEKTTEPHFRKSGLEALCSLYFAQSGDRISWKATPLIDAFLRASLYDRRVDQTFLLNEMVAHQIPISDPEQLVALASEHLSLEPFMIHLLLAEEEIPDSAFPLLERIAKSESHDRILRAQAGRLLLRKGNDRLSEVLPIIIALMDLDLPVESIEALRSEWRRQSGQSDQVNWMIGQARSASFDKAVLASIALLQMADREDLSDELAITIHAWLKETAEKGGNRLRALLEAVGEIDYAEAGNLISKAYRGEDEALRKVAASVASRLSLDPASGKPIEGKLKERDPAELVSLLAGVEGDLEQGRSLFGKLGCASCHNVHGEGPLFGPDIVDSASTLSPGEFVSAILFPGKKVRSGELNRVFELENGVQLFGIVQERNADAVRIRDRSGNFVAIPLERIRWEWESDRPIMHESLGNDLSVADLASLRAFLLHLGGIDS